jgi:lipopolysaccharide transport system ATP-binding protein
MSDVAIKVEGLGKRYKIGKLQRRHDTLRDRIADARIFRPFKRNGNSHQGNGSALTSDPRPLTSDTDLWALRDVSFEVKRGEVVGIIGRNGAGKSTLLKILSRITEPTEGYADINGRVASLLEVGTGFQPELSGRENIYLNGAILGMKRAEIVRRFDEIVAFAEVEKFIDTPVKRYSSGMYLRLAFAVAAHLEPEILLVDEVLAVGDAEFQSKCLGKMRDVAKEGRTVLFVSHNLTAVRRLCTTTLLLERGQVSKVDQSDAVIAYYMNRQGNVGAGSIVTKDLLNRNGSGRGRIVKIGFTDEWNKETNTIGVGRSFKVWFEIEGDIFEIGIVTGLEIKQPDGTPLLNLRSDSEGINFRLRNGERRLAVEIDIPGLPFYPGRYLIEPWFADKRGGRIDHLYGAVFVTLESHGVFASESLIQPGRGVLFMDCKWTQKDMSVVEASSR